MGLENVIEEIISQAERNKEEIISQAKNEAEKIVDEATYKAKEQAELFAEEARKVVDDNERMEISSLNIQLHKTVLETKKSILDEIFMRFRERIENIDSKKRKEILLNLLGKAKRELPDAKFVYCNEKDRMLLPNTSMQFNGTIDCLGGVVVESSGGKIRVNYTFDSMLEKLKETWLNESAKRIFQTD